MSPTLCLGGGRYPNKYMAFFDNYLRHKSGKTTSHCVSNALIDIFGKITAVSVID